MPARDFDPQRVRRALVVKLRHHGDVLLTSPVFSALKNHVPGIEVDALVYADTAPMLELHPAIAQVHTIDRKWKERGFAHQLACERRLLSALRARRYDLLVHLTPHPRGAWLARLTGAGYAVAPRRSGRFWCNSFDRFYLSLSLRHTVEINLDALRVIGIQPAPDERALTLVPGAAAEARIDALLASRGVDAGRFVMIHPASRWPFKCWPTQKMAELIRVLQEDGRQIVLTSGPDPDERRAIEAITARLASPATSFAGELSLKEMAALIARAQLFVGVDSAPMHMAAAVQTPVVAIFGPTNEANWRPWMVSHRVVASAAHSCRPCGADGCGGSKLSDCLESLPVDAVLQAVRELLAETDR